MSWKGIVGKCFTPAEFDVVAKATEFAAFTPRFVVVHNTMNPKLADWAKVTGDEQMREFQHDYRDLKGWSAGPHLFIAPEGIWVFTPLNLAGTHSPSWNGVAWGVEVVGDYATEFLTDVMRENLTSALASLHEAGNLDPDNIRCHHEDPLTTHKGCPGAHLVKRDVINWVRRKMDPEATPTF